ncbi:MarR family winged helix-turn-helix transcriptional regulator [Nocardioides panacisoli]|uniref:MarR family winged helix-turn-helix transcriptional regulator n=1 Tax=Nocardioides panacisoli TaxID=627624 RepID=UPI0031D78FB2
MKVQATDSAVDSLTHEKACALTTEEMETWRAVNRLLAHLPPALGSQLQCDAGLSHLEYYVLKGLSEQPDRTLRMSTLAALAHSELSRLSHLMRRLEERGLVRREPDRSDRRFTNAILTDAGLEHLTQAAPRHIALVRKLVFDVLDEDEQLALRNAAQKIVTGLKNGSC